MINGIRPTGSHRRANTRNRWACDGKGESRAAAAARHRVLGRGLPQPEGDRLRNRRNGSRLEDGAPQVVSGQVAPRTGAVARAPEQIVAAAVVKSHPLKRPRETR